MTDHPPFPTACARLFGPDWRTMLPTLSAMLGVNVRTLQRWANGQNAPPDVILARVCRIAKIAGQSRAEAERDRLRRASESVVVCVVGDNSNRTNTKSTNTKA